MSRLTEAEVAMMPAHIRRQIADKLAAQPSRSSMVDQTPQPTIKLQDDAPISKYRNEKCEIDGVTFDSKKEGRRYLRLKAMQLAGSISGLEIQPEYVIMVNGIEICRYIADFRYTWIETSEKVTEDVKSVATSRKEVYRLKRKLVEAQYGIEIREV